MNISAETKRRVHERVLVMLKDRCETLDDALMIMDEMCQLIEPPRMRRYYKRKVDWFKRERTKPAQLSQQPLK